MISSPSIRHYLMPPIIVISTHHCRSFLESIRSPPHHHLSLSFSLLLFLSLSLSLSIQLLLEREMKRYLLCLFVRWLSLPRGVICDYNVHLCTDNGLAPYSLRPLCPGLVIWLCMFSCHDDHKSLHWRKANSFAFTSGFIHCLRSLFNGTHAVRFQITPIILAMISWIVESMYSRISSWVFDCT